MERHFKARSTDVNRPSQPRETPRSLSRLLLAFQASAIGVTFIFLLWCLWKLPQENNEFPDGLIQCPPSSYRILNKRNITIACKTCPVCPAGQRPTLPCGSSIFPKSLLMFTECISSKTVSKEKGYGEALKVRLQTNNSKPTTAAKVHNGTYQSTASSLVPKVREEKVNTALKQKNTKLTTKLHSSYSKDVEKLLSILIATAIILTLLVVMFIAVIVTCIFWKIKCCPNCSQSQESTILSDDEFYEAAFFVSDNMAESSSVADIDAHTAGLQDEVTKKEMEQNKVIQIVDDVNLADLPTHVEEFLIKKLDVRCPGQRFYGWQKVGEAFHVDKDDLRYLKIEYKRDNGSPTSKLFEMLGKTQNRNVSDLVEVLRSPEIRRPDIVPLIKLT